MSSPLHAPQDPAPAGHPVSVILVCHICEHLWEPTGEDRIGVPLACNECGGWTMIAELAEPTPDTTGPH